VFLFDYFWLPVLYLLAFGLYSVIAQTKDGTSTEKATQEIEQGQNNEGKKKIKIPFNFYLFIILAVWNVFWYLIYCKYYYVEPKDSIGNYGCLAFRYDLLLTLALQMIIGVFNLIYFAIKKSYFNLVLYLILIGYSITFISSPADLGVVQPIIYLFSYLGTDDLIASFIFGAYLLADLLTYIYLIFVKRR